MVIVDYPHVLLLQLFDLRVLLLQLFNLRMLLLLWGVLQLLLDLLFMLHTTMPFAIHAGVTRTSCIVMSLWPALLVFYNLFCSTNAS
jgi:hypothetical protein